MFAEKGEKVEARAAVRMIHLFCLLLNAEYRCSPSKGVSSCVSSSAEVRLIFKICDRV